MNQHLFIAVAFIGGVFLAVQSAFSTQLGIILKKPVLASLFTYTSGALFALMFVLIYTKEFINLQYAKQVPWYLWFIGGLFSVTGLTLYYYSIPKIGIAQMMSLGLCGQLIFSVIAGHYGWLNLPIEPITFKRTIGAIAMMIGIYFINLK